MDVIKAIINDLAKCDKLCKVDTLFEKGISVATSHFISLIATHSGFARNNGETVQEYCKRYLEAQS
jgi:hypothetical protein